MVPEPNEASSMYFVALATIPANSVKKWLFNVFMNTAKLDQVAAPRMQLIPESWVSWVVKPKESSSKGFAVLAMNPANPAKA